VAQALQKQGVLVSPLGRQQIRACTHLDVSASQAERAAEVLRQAPKRGIKRTAGLVP